MAFKFVPTRLSKARERVVINHPLTATVIKINPSDDLRHLIMKIVLAEESELEMIVYSLTDYEVKLVASYIPFNYYEVKMENLFEVLKYRGTKEVYRLLYIQWQESYSKTDCNELMEIYLTDCDEFLDVLKTYHLDRGEYFSWLKSDIIPRIIGKSVMNMPSAKGVSLSDKLDYFGIQNGSKLWVDIKYLYYTFCTREDYLALADAEMVGIVMRYKYMSIFQAFLENFLKKLSPRDLDEYERVANFFDSKIGDNFGAKFNEFFKGFKAELIDKYVDWINAYKLSLYFGNDERSVFWKEYRHRTVKKFSYSGSIVMEFNDYYAVEFLGKAMGPAYIYEKMYYEQKVRSVVEGRYNSNTDLKQYLFHNTSYEDESKWIKTRGYDGTRLKHNPNPGWQRKFRAVIRNEEITIMRKI